MDKINQKGRQTDIVIETIDMKIVELIVIFGFGLDRKKTDDKMSQIDVELESNRLFEETGR